MRALSSFGYSVIMLVSLVGSANSADVSYSGSWMLDVGSSNFPDASQTPKSLVWDINQTRERISWTFERVAKDGSKLRTSFDNLGDSKPHSIVGSDKDATGWVKTRTDGSMVFNFSDPDGHTLAFDSVCSLSSDEKTMTCTGSQIKSTPESKGVMTPTSLKLVYRKVS